MSRDSGNEGDNLNARSSCVKTKFITVSTELKCRETVDRESMEWIKMYIALTHQLENDGNMAELGAISFYLTDISVLANSKRKDLQVSLLSNNAIATDSSHMKPLDKDDLKKESATLNMNSYQDTDNKGNAKSTSFEKMSDDRKYYNNDGIQDLDDEENSELNLSNSESNRYLKRNMSIYNSKISNSSEGFAVGYSGNEYLNINTEGNAVGFERKRVTTNYSDIECMFSQLPMPKPEDELANFPMEYRRSIFIQNFVNSSSYRKIDYIKEPTLYTPDKSLDWGMHDKSAEVIEGECPMANRPRRTWILGDSQAKRVAGNGNFVWISTYSGRLSFKFRRSLDHFRNASQLGTIVLFVGTVDALEMINKPILETCFCSNIFNLIADLRARGFTGRIIFPTLCENVLGANALNNKIRKCFFDGKMLNAELMEFNKALIERSNSHAMNKFLECDGIHISYEGGYVFAWELAKMGVFINDRIRDLFLNQSK